jgi:hypothetical protein
MSNFDPNNALSIDSNVINYNLSYPVDIYKSDVAVIKPADGSALNYYKIKYNNGVNTNLFFSGVNPPSYTAKNIYFFGLLHNNVIGQSDQGTAYTGEIVIEYTNNSNSNTIYTCFFIQPDTTNTANTSIDQLQKLVTASANAPAITGISLGDIPKQSQYFYYNDTGNSNNIVILFLTPITISKTAANWFNNVYSKCPLFTTQAPLEQSVPTPSTDGSATDNQIYIDCNPAGVSEDTITTYNLPINSELMGEKQQMDFMKTSVNFFIFIIATILAYFAIPMLYKRIVIDSVTKQDTAGALNGIKPLTRVRSLDIFISLIVFVGIVVCFVLGFLQDNFQALSGGLFLLVLYGLSIALIQANKAGDTWITEKVNYKKDGSSIETSLKDFLQVATMNALYFILIKMGKIYLATLIVIAITIFGIGVYTNKPIDDTTNKITIAAIILLPIAAMIKLLL